MSTLSGVYTFKFLPKNVLPPIFGGLYATAVGANESLIGAPHTPTYIGRQGWLVTPIEKGSGIYTISFARPSVEGKLYINTKSGVNVDNDAIVLSTTPKEWIIVPSSLPGGGYVITAVSPLIGVTLCIGLSHFDELVLKSFPVVPGLLHNRPRWDFTFYGTTDTADISGTGLGPIFIPTTLGEWASQKITALYEAKGEQEVSAAVGNFLSRTAKITYNGVQISLEEYKKTILDGVPLERAAKANILDTVEVPADVENPNEAGNVGVFYRATLVSGLLLFGAPEEYLSTTSLDATVKQDETVNDIDQRRVFELTQVTSTVPTLAAPGAPPPPRPPVGGRTPQPPPPAPRPPVGGRK